MRGENHRIVVMLMVNSLGGGGAEQQLLELVRGIDKDRFKPIVVTLYPGRALESMVKEVPGVEYICLNRKNKYDFSILFKVLRLLRQKQVDIVQPFLTPSTFFGLLPALINCTPVKVVTERCGVRVNTHLGNKLYRKIEDYFTRFAEHVVPNSQAGRSYLIGRGIDPNRIKLIYNGVNLQRLSPNPAKVAKIRKSMELPPDGMVVGITASLSPAKNHATFIEAAQLIHQTMPQTKFAVVGDGPLLASLENQAKELGLASHVVFFGHQLDIGSYISTFDVACLCSVDHEGCSNALLEAMALGKPIVATDVGGNKELVENGETGLLIPLRDPHALADSVLFYLRQPEWAREIGERARDMIHEYFGLERMVHEYEQLYDRAMYLKQNGGPDIN